MGNCSWNVKLLLTQPGWTWGAAGTASDGAKITLQPQNSFSACVGRERWWMEELGIPIPFPKNMCRALHWFTETIPALLHSDFEKLFPVGWRLRLKSFGCISEDISVCFGFYLLGLLLLFIYLFEIAFALQWLWYGVMTNHISVPPSYKSVGQKDKDLFFFSKKPLKGPPNSEWTVCFVSMRCLYPLIWKWASLATFCM